MTKRAALTVVAAGCGWNIRAAGHSPSSISASSKVCSQSTRTRFLSLTSLSLGLSHSLHLEPWNKAEASAEVQKKKQKRQHGRPGKSLLFVTNGTLEFQRLNLWLTERKIELPRVVTYMAWLPRQTVSFCDSKHPGNPRAKPFLKTKGLNCRGLWTWRVHKLEGVPCQGVESRM